MATVFITCHYCKNSVHKVSECKRRSESEFRWKSQEIQQSKKIDVATITLAVIRIRSDSSSDEKVRKISKMEDRKNVAGCTIALVIQARNIIGRRVAVNVRTVLLLSMGKTVKNIKPMLRTAQPLTASRAAVTTVKLRRSLMKAKSNIHHHPVPVSLFPLVIYRSSVKQIVFSR